MSNAYTSNMSRLVEMFMMLSELVAFILFLAGLASIVLIIG